MAGDESPCGAGQSLLRKYDTHCRAGDFMAELHFPPAPSWLRTPSREYAMANAHLSSLSARHARLDANLAAELRRPMPDAATVARLKREKLRLKDEVAASTEH
jgi:hypothetical protein